MEVFRINDIVVFKNATKFGSLEHRITALATLCVELDGHCWYPNELLVLC